MPEMAQGKSVRKPFVCGGDMTRGNMKPPHKYKKEENFTLLINIPTALSLLSKRSYQFYLPMPGMSCT